MSYIGNVLNPAFVTRKPPSSATVPGDAIRKLLDDPDAQLLPGS
jgi:hypothetical protein